MPFPGGTRATGLSRFRSKNFTSDWRHESGPDRADAGTVGAAGAEVRDLRERVCPFEQQREDLRKPGVRERAEEENTEKVL